MKKSNWPNNWDLSHPNWTGRTPSQCKCLPRTREKEPSILAQVALGVLEALGVLVVVGVGVLVAFMAAVVFMVGVFALQLLI